MKNIELFSIPDPSLQELDGGIYTDGEKYYVCLCFEQEPEYGEGADSSDISQYPLEDILDKFYVSVSDFCETSNSQKNKECKLVFSSNDIDNVRKLKSIIGKHVYNKTVGQEVVDLIIK